MLREQEGREPTGRGAAAGTASARRAFYKWKAKFGGLEVSEAKRLRALEDENGRLKRMLADAMLDNAALKDLLGKSGDARRATGGGEVFAPSVRDQRAAGLPGDGADRTSVRWRDVRFLRGQRGAGPDATDAVTAFIMSTE